MDIPFLLEEFLTIRAGKDRRGSPLYGGMLITQLARSFGILEKLEASFLIIKLGNSSPLLYKWVHIVDDNGYGNYSIPIDNSQNQPGRRVRQRGGNGVKRSLQ